MTRLFDPKMNLILKKCSKDVPALNFNPKYNTVHPTYFLYYFDQLYKPIIPMFDIHFGLVFMVDSFFLNKADYKVSRQ